MKARYSRTAKRFVGGLIAHSTDFVDARSGNPTDAVWSRSLRIANRALRRHARGIRVSGVKRGREIKDAGTSGHAVKRVRMELGMNIRYTDGGVWETCPGKRDRIGKESLDAK